MNIELYKEQAKRIYTEDEWQAIERAIATLKEKLVNSLGLFYDKAEIAQDERIDYAEYEVTLFLSEFFCSHCARKKCAKSQKLEGKSVIKTTKITKLRSYKDIRKESENLILFFC